MARGWTAGLVALALLTGCLEHRLVDCGNGILCPTGKQCIAGRCASANDIAACSGVADGEPCEADTGPGVCLDGACATSICGDGRVDALEVCDDGNRISGDGCSGTCASDETCGNGVLELAEACDCGDADHPGLPSCNGTSNGGELCRTDCTLPRCGNGETEGLEVCDDGNLISGDGCAASCASNETCGNGVIDFALDEQCDDGNLVDHDGCQHTCVIQRCGDGIVDAADDEVCDDGNLASGDGCSPDCASDETCGNGILDFFAGEMCDDGNKRSHDGCHSQCVLETPVWAQTGPETIAAASPAIAYDAGRERVVLYIGDTLASPPISETYELTDTGWVRANPVESPSPRDRAAMTYDVARGEIVLFGGATEEGYNADTWTYNGSAWRLRAPARSPSARSTHAMAYDPVRERVVVHAGEDEFGFLGDTWEWDGLTWTEVGAPVAELTDRALGSMAYDLGRQRMLRVYGATYEYDGSGWTELTGIAPINPELIAYDVGRGRMMAAGDGKTYELVGNTWTEVNAGASPPGGFEFGMAYDARRREVVFHGAFLATETWRHDGTSWAKLVASPRPPALYGMGLTYDNVRDRVIVFGGNYAIASGASDETWEFDGARWSQITTAGAPSARYAPMMTYDVARKRAVLFGGRDANSDELDDTWEYNGTSWTPGATVDRPDGRTLGAMTYDPDQKRCVLVGGITSSFFTLGDMWGYDGSNWSTIASTAPTPRRMEHGLAYDEADDRVVMFGGYFSGPKGDTWAHDGATWSELGSPVGPLDYPALAYLPSRGRVVRFGGFGSVRAHELDDAAWRASALLGFDRTEHRLATDALRDRVLLFGGFSDISPVTESDDLWEYRYRSTEPDEYCAGGRDRDGDGLAGCADPDCAAACSPMCPPLTTCPVDAVKCGDGACGVTESKRLCPQDCGAITPLCGDGWCDAPETAVTCNADC